ncbi:hypothetical protein [Nitrosophilus alvini]|uniref:hypothetical protein n=1 Tax=Nitrosophilus alvini TaxID=2714855 RepID=UPI00190E1336|nr:hypothetical protein [Nitrosophilus alvini]
MDFFEKWIEYDFNPFLMFNKEGKVVSLNQEAQFLIGSVAPSVLYELALSYASASYGFKTTFVNLEFGRFKFFGICVGYENDENIGIKLYQYPSMKIENIEEDVGEITNIYALIDLCISANATKTDAKFTKILDPTFPEIKIKTEYFIKLLNHIYELFLDSKEIKTKLYFKIGEYLKLKQKKYTLFAIDICGDNIKKSSFDELKELAQEINGYIETHKNCITISAPIIYND